MTLRAIRLEIAQLVPLLDRMIECTAEDERRMRLALAMLKELRSIEDKGRE